MVDQTRLDQVLSNLASYIAVLVDSGILDETQREPLQSLARFRNRLVHLYQDIDDRRVYGYLQDSLDHLNGFVRTVAQWFPQHRSAGRPASHHARRPHAGCLDGICPFLTP